MRMRGEEYEDIDSVVYEYESDYECVSCFFFISEGSYTGDQQNTLMEVLSYCQIMYDAIQKLDKKFDVLHRKVSEMQHARVKPVLLKPVIVRFAVQNGHVPVNSAMKHAQQSLQFESQQPVGRQSPPLPTIVSTHSLHSSYTAANGMPNLSPQPNPASSIVESTVNIVSSPVASSSMPAPSETRKYFCFTKEFLGDPARNVKVLENHLLKARQKSKPNNAARYLVRVLFPKKTLLCSVMGVSTQGHRTLDPNKIAAIREFLATNFPTYDLSEHGKDWKTCVMNVNAMIRCLRSERKKKSRSRLKETTEGKEKVADASDTSPSVDVNCSGDCGGNSQNCQKMTGSTTKILQNLGSEKFPEAFHTSLAKAEQSLEPMEHLGSPWRNVQLPFSVIYVAKGKTRPELSARYLVRHMFTEDVLVKSNVYGSADRGMKALDFNKINALRDFLQENFPSFDLSESGFDWKACVAAINSTIRSLRHEVKKAAFGL
ncbi:BEN domain-containing protein 2, partial [Acanthisitta chloris]